MSEEQGPDDIIKQVTLLGIYKKEPSESLDDVLMTLVDTGMYPSGKKQAIEVFSSLRDERLIVEEKLSMLGIMQAQKADTMFKQG